MKLYMMRHGESYANKNSLFSLPDVPLTENGIKDAESLGRVISGIRFDRVLVSPYLRAQQTLHHALPGVTGEIVDQLHECDCGSLEGNPIKEMRALYPSLEDEIRVEDYRRYGGENYADMRKRVRELMEYVISLNAEHVAAFSHAGLIQTFFDEVMGREGKVGRNVRCSNGSVNVFEYKNGTWFVYALNVRETL